MNDGVSVEELRTEHQNLEQQIVEENLRPHPDELRISELKRQKLRIKDELARLSPEPAH